MKEQNTKEPRRENITVMIFFPPVYADGQGNYSSNCSLHFTRDVWPWGIRRQGGKTMKMHSHRELWSRAFILSVPSFLTG